MVKKGNVSRYNYVFDSVGKLCYEKLITEKFRDILMRMFSACELYDRHKVYAGTITVEVMPNSVNKMLEHMDTMRDSSAVDNDLHDEVCRLIKKYRALKNDLGKAPYDVDANTVYNMIWDEGEYFEKTFAGFNLMEKREIKRRNPYLYPYLNEVKPEKVETPYVPYPVYKWTVNDKTRVAGETLIHKFGLSMRPTKISQFNAVIGLCQDHGGVSGTPFYADCVKYFRDGCKGQSKKGRAYDFMRYMRELMREADPQFYYSLVGTPQIVPVKNFIEACSFKLLELQKVLN